MSKICILTGAGIGVPLNLPTATGFTNTIKKIDNSLFQYIKLHLGPNSNDIEKVLFVLEEFANNENLFNHILDSNNNTHYPPVRADINNLKQLARNGILQIKSDIFELLENFDTDLSFELYSSIIKEILTTFVDPSISFFTTNYDLTFESGFAENEDKLNKIGIEGINYGFTGKLRSIYDPKEDFKWNPTIIEYKKLHGSLDWNIDRGKCIKAGATRAPKEPEKMPLIFPGYKGTPSDQPFIDIHEWLFERLGQADVVLVLGFAFRDQYINNIFDFSLKRNDKLLIISYNPCLPNGFPPDSKHTYFTHRYKNFIHIPQSIEIKNFPLNLYELIEKNNPLKDIIAKDLINHRQPDYQIY